MKYRKKYSILKTALIVDIIISILMCLIYSDYKGITNVMAISMPVTVSIFLAMLIYKPMIGWDEESKGHPSDMFNHPSG